MQIVTFAQLTEKRKSINLVCVLFLLILVKQDMNGMAMHQKIQIVKNVQLATRTMEQAQEYVLL